MITRALLALALAAAASSHEHNKHKQYDDPFALMDQIVHAVFPPRIKLWPWHDIFQEDPKLISNQNKCEFDLYVRRFAPEHLRVKAKNRFITVEGRKETNGDMLLTNRFVQNFALPPGCKEDEVTAVYNDGMLYISAPKHELPKPPPERIIPIEVKKRVVIETTTSKEVDKVDDSTEDSKEEENKKEATTSTSTAAPVEQPDEEATTAHGKIRKKELKTTTKKTKDNEVSKNEDNALDYAEVDAAE